MNYLTSANTDIGIKKETNQDSLTIKVANTSMGKVIFTVLCDGMGGLAKGEVASASVIRSFSNWFIQEFPMVINKRERKDLIVSRWNQIIQSENERIMNYGKYHNVKLGTTVTVMLFVEDTYYVLNVGDARVYEITHTLNQITKDQTVVAHEMELGKLTIEEALIDPRRNVLLQCVGASNIVIPDIYIGKILQNSVYMLCTDGFRHQITKEEILEYFHPNQLRNIQEMDRNSKYLIDLNKSRLEKDNISVILIRTY